MKLIPLPYLLAAAFAAGAVSGGATTWKLMRGGQIAAELTEVKAEVRAERAVRTRQNVVAVEYETQRAVIDSEKTEVADAVQQYLEARPDVRAIDLGDEWLCLVAAADGLACATRRADRGVSAPAAGGPATRADAAGLPDQPPDVSAVRAAASKARESQSARQN